MKTGYKLVIAALAIIWVLLERQIYCGLFGETLKYNYMLQTAALFIALGSGIIALSSADKKSRKIKVDIQVSIADEKPAPHEVGRLPKKIQDFYTTSSLMVYSYRVFFKFRNKSNFTLSKPTLAFRLPNANQHPFSVLVPIEFGGRRTTMPEWHIGYNSNMFNSEEEIRMLEFEDAKIISNTNLPFWNDSDVLEIWIRMCLDKNSNKPIKVTVSVNSENAEGITKEVEITNKLIPDK